MGRLELGFCIIVNLLPNKRVRVADRKLPPPEIVRDLGRTLCRPRLRLAHLLTRNLYAPCKNGLNKLGKSIAFY